MAYGNGKQCLTRFTTADTNPADRVSVWRDFMNSRILGVNILADQSQNFNSEALLHDFGPIAITRFELMPQVMARGLYVESENAVCLSIVESGKVIAKRNGSSLALHPGDAVMIPTGSSSSLHFVEPTVFWGIRIQDGLSLPDHARLQEAAAKHSHLSGPTIDVTLAYCKLMHQTQPGREQAMGTKIREHIVDFLDGMLHAA